MYTILSQVIIGSLLFTGCVSNSTQQTSSEEAFPEFSYEKISTQYENLQKAYFASGCFWCVEAIFESVEGVEEVISGYAGGKKENANYQVVSSGMTDHAEAVEVYYNPDLIDYQTLLKVFFGSHDPTTLNRQGPDTGPQYRSAIFFQNKEEKQMAEAYIKELEQTNAFKEPIVTTLEPFEAFYPAEDYHQDYEKKNPNQPYVQRVSIPRLKRFQKKYPELLKKDQVAH